MKKNVFTLSVLTLCTALALTSCSGIEPENISSNKTITIEFQQVDPAPATGADTDTRTEYHENTIWWSKGDQIGYCQYALVNSSMSYKRTYVTLSSSRETASATISSFSTPDEGSTSYYCSYYPYASYEAYSASSGHIRARISTPSVQFPTASSYDPAADLLISDYVENLTQNGEGKYSVMMSYYRQVALGKMSIVKLPSVSEIDSVEFSAICDETDVTLAGAKWYDFTTLGPTSVYSRSYKLTLDYSAQNISGDMTAHFCCYPFALDAGDSFTVKAYTKAGEVFTRKVNLTGAQTLTLEAGHGTRFTVDMSTATKTDNWITVKEYSDNTHVKTTNKIYYAIKKDGVAIKSGKFMAVSETAFAEINDISAYLDAHGTAFSESTISNINEGKLVIFNTASLTGDSWYVAMCKMTHEDDSEGIAITRVKTDWFTMTATTRNAGGVNYYYYGANLAASTKNVRIMATADLPDGQTFETYYTSTLAPGGIPSSTLTAINETGSAGYYTTKYYVNKTDQANMVAGTNYTVMCKATNTRGQTKFVSVSVNAGGSTE